MSDNPFLALFESSPLSEIKNDQDSSVVTSACNSVNESQQQINNFYERVFSFTVDNSKRTKWDGSTSFIFLENLAQALAEKQNYLQRDIIGQAICERIFYDQDDLDRLVTSNGPGSSTDIIARETRLVGNFMLLKINGGNVYISEVRRNSIFL